MTQIGEVILDEQRLIARILESQNSGDFVSTRLQTDERVIARVTDGIYRQPASALRELISNAYDADATRVVIQTDAPRFDRISVEDDGVGMTPATLAHLLRHIGGSAKRNDEGRGLGVTHKLTSP
jgi:signal transduction histidine kinase